MQEPKIGEVFEQDDLSFTVVEGTGQGCHSKERGTPCAFHARCLLGGCADLMCGPTSRKDKKFVVFLMEGVPDE